MRSTSIIKGLLLTFTLLTTLTSYVYGTCRFPQFMQRNYPWVGDYKNGPLVAYIRPNSMDIRETLEGGTTVKFTRECEQRAPDNKFLVRHKEKGQPTRYLCMQFLQRGENIVQIKTSKQYPRQSLEICEESKMAIDPFPLVQTGQTPDNKISCPFKGGYNIYAYYPHPNNSIVCPNLLLLMRMESECDQGEGITFDFRKEECVPKGLPPNPVQRAHCVAHWTQGLHTFIVLQHAEEHEKMFCLRTADPLSNIQSAFLWLKVICDVSEVPSVEWPQDYLRLELTKRIFASTCEDELELCQDMTHYCNLAYKRHCAHTCGQCMSENQIGMCAFKEQYKGRWIESNTHSDTIIDVDAYTLDAGKAGRYDCLNLDSSEMPEKRVLLELYDNGCVPRYACVEMEKVTSSVMKFRLGDRLTWPLMTTQNAKLEICKSDHFQVSERPGSLYTRERPARLLVNTGNIKEVHCKLPKRLQNGIAFREDGKHCGGCLNYEPSVSPNHFVISPVNCSMESGDNKGYRNMPIQYSCLASFEFYNETYSVVTKTTSFVNGMGQYLVWIFTPENHIKVLKAADTFEFEMESLIRSKLIQAQFSILRNDNLQCRHFVFLPRSTTTTTTAPQQLPWGPNGNTNNGYYSNGNGKPHDNNGYYATGPTGHDGKDPGYTSHNDKGDSKDSSDSQINAPVDNPKFDEAKGKDIDDKNLGTRVEAVGVFTLLCSTAVLLFVVNYRTHGPAHFLNTT